MGEDEGEDVIRKVQLAPENQEKVEYLRNTYPIGSKNAEGCDGWHSEWVPFGRKVTYCEYASWYIPFWK